MRGQADVTEEHVQDLRWMRWSDMYQCEGLSVEAYGDGGLGGEDPQPGFGCIGERGKRWVIGRLHRNGSDVGKGCQDGE